MQSGPREHLLCAGCERQFSRYETYGAKVLRLADEASPDAASGDALVPDVDARMFRLFGLSLLWRAHASRLHSFKAVRLGPLAEPLRTMLLTEQPGEAHQFGFVLGKITGLTMRGQMMLSPVKRRFAGRWCYLFMARGYEWIFLASRDTASLASESDFTGGSSTLRISKAEYDQHRLLTLLQRAFPKALAEARRARGSGTKD